MKNTIMLRFSQLSPQVPLIQPEIQALVYLSHSEFIQVNGHAEKTMKTTKKSMIM